MGFLTLSEGQVFKGEASGDWKEPIQGEIVFFTGMTGYQEVLTDPSYKGQIVVFTYPLIGNYGVSWDSLESEQIQPAGVVMFQCASFPSHHSSLMSLSDYLKSQEVPFLTGVDTREVTKAIRIGGTHQAVLSIEPAQPKADAEHGQVYQVKGSQVQTFGEGHHHIALIDFGWKKSILTSLLKGGCKVTVLPFTLLDQVKQLHPDGVVLSNGPGDPKDVLPIMPTLKQVITEYPTLGICLGHQLIALSFGADTTKMSFGHRGANHPVQDLFTGNVMMTSQNHSYVVNENSLEHTGLSKRFLHVNDGTVEGLAHPELPILSTQFHPEANPGPEDAMWLFTEFFNLVQAKGEKVHV